MRRRKQLPHHVATFKPLPELGRTKVVDFLIDTVIQLPAKPLVTIKRRIIESAWRPKRPLAGLVNVQRGKWPPGRKTLEARSWPPQKASAQSMQETAQ